MAKRGRTTSIDKLLSRLKDLDSERKAIVDGIKAAVAHIMDGEAPLPLRVKKGKTKAKAASSVAADPIEIEPIRKKRKRSKTKLEISRTQAVSCGPSCDRRSAEGSLGEV